eukprot:3353793-Amphidinium_carterae.1
MPIAGATGDNAEPLQANALHKRQDHVGLPGLQGPLELHSPMLLPARLCEVAQIAPTLIMQTAACVQLRAA